MICYSPSTNGLLSPHEAEPVGKVRSWRGGGRVGNHHCRRIRNPPFTHARCRLLSPFEHSPAGCGERECCNTTAARQAPEHSSGKPSPIMNKLNSVDCLSSCRVAHGAKRGDGGQFPDEDKDVSRPDTDPTLPTAIQGPISVQS